MKIQSSPTSFQYNHPLKTLWKKGKLPTVTHGLYGGVLTRDTVSLEHLDCFCYSHNNDISNLALATKKNNCRRGNRDIKLFLSTEQVNKYLIQFLNIKLNNFDGNKYIESIKKTLKELGIFC